MFTKIHHVAFVVEDIESSMEDFESIYDMELVTHDTLDTENFSMDVALYYAGENIIELIEPLTDSGWSYEVLQENGEGFFHMAFEVEDIRESMERLEANGIRVKDDEPQEGFAWELVTLDDRDTIVPMQLVETTE